MTSTLLRNFKLPTPLYSANSLWRQKVVGLASLPYSEAQAVVTHDVLSAAGVTTMLINYSAYSVPIFKAKTEGEPRFMAELPICDYEGKSYEVSPTVTSAVTLNGGRIVRNVPLPAGTVRPAEAKTPQESLTADGHLVLYNPDLLEEWDFWQATTQRAAGHEHHECHSLGGGIEGDVIYEAGSVARFKVDGTGTQGPATSPLNSARGTGVPLLGGLLLPEDLQGGVDSVIAHALAFILPRLRYFAHPSADRPNYVFPATKTETDGSVLPDPNALAAGQRIRLKDELVDTQGNSINEVTLTQTGVLVPITRIFFKALREYGAYLVDRGDAFTFFAEHCSTANLELTDAQVKALIENEYFQPTDEIAPTNWAKVLWKLYEQLSWELGGGGISFGAIRNGSFYSNFEIVG